MERFQLDNGLTVVAERLPSFRSVSIGLWVRVGSVNETAETSGISHLLEHLFFKGTATRTAREIMELVESVGGTANAFTSREYTCLYAKVLDAHLPLALDLLSDILLHSVYADFEREKAVIEEEIQSYYETPEEHVHDLFAEQLWEGHPLGRSITGTREAVRGIGLDDVREYYAAWYAPTNAVLALAGNVDLTELPARVERVFGGWTGDSRRQRSEAPVPHTASVADRREIFQTHVCIGTHGLTADDPRRYAFSILTSALGGSAISRLFQRVREEEGLAYQVNAFHNTMECSGMLGVYSAQGPDNLDRVADIVAEEFRDLCVHAMSHQELRTTKEQLKGNIMLGLESTSNRMMRLARSTLALDRVDDLDVILARIDAVTADQVRELATELFRPERMVYVVLGPVDALTPRPLR